MYGKVILTLNNNEQIEYQKFPHKLQQFIAHNICFEQFSQTELIDFRSV